MSARGNDGDGKVHRTHGNDREERRNEEGKKLGEQRQTVDEERDGNVSWERGANGRVQSKREKLLDETEWPPCQYPGIRYRSLRLFAFSFTSNPGRPSLFRFPVFLFRS